ncbi:MAG: hypothetical protein GDA36_08950 [Rhodobacteraceae bacterium]|nr:hypothetical protein [Paracoccaceae bacterium]
MHLLLRGSCVERGSRIGTDDVLTRIDIPVGWRWCSPTCKRALGRTWGHQGYDLMVRLKCLLIGQWHPKAGVGPSTVVGFHLCCGHDLFAPVPDATTRCRFRNL